MSALGIIGTLIIIAASIAVLLLPILRREKSLKGTALTLHKEREALLTAYERVLTTIRDLDEDFRVGKLAQAEYDRERELWSDRGVEVLQALEKAGGARPKHVVKPAARKAAVVAADPDAEKALDEAIEQAIANYVTAKAGK